MIKHENQNIVKNLNDLINSNYHYNHGIKIEITMNGGPLILPLIKGQLYSRLFKSRSYINATYVIINAITKEFYIGSTNDIYTRICEHRYGFNNLVNPVKRLQESFLQTNKNYFDISAIITKDRETAYSIEQLLLDIFKDNPNCCNIAINAKKSNLGLIFSDEHRQKLKYERSDITKEKISKANKGKIISEETRNKINLANIGKRKGIPLPEWHRKILLNASIGRVSSNETRKKISLKLKNRFFTNEHREKISLSKINNKNIQLCLNNGLKRSKPIMLKGIKYPSIREAGRAIGMNDSSIIYRLRNNNLKFKDDYYL